MLPQLLREIVDNHRLCVNSTWLPRSESVPVDLNAVQQTRRPAAHGLGKTYGGVEGSLTERSFVRAMNSACLNETSVFLDIGCGGGEPMVAAKKNFQVRLSIGLDMNHYACRQTIEYATQSDVAVFPVHATAECFMYS